MANVVINIGGRPYTMQCPDGEEDHLKELARLLDLEVGRIKQSVGSIGDIRLMVMSGLMVADRLAEATKKIEALELLVQGLREERNLAMSKQKSVEEHFTGKLEEAAARMAKAAELLEK
jgi:cell division protein ZapA